MPTYEFRCESGHATDQFFRSINSAPSVIECPECGQSAVRQVSGGAGLVFKGSGFYITDYARKSQPDEGGKGAGGDAKSESKSESKPESKSTESKASSSTSSKPDKSSD